MNVYRKRGFWVFAWGSVIRPTERISWFIDSSSLMLLAHIHPPQFTHGTYGWIQLTLPWSNQKALGHFIPGQHEWRRHLHPTLVSWHWNPSCQRFHCVRFGNISLLVIPATGSIVQDEESTAQPGGAISYIGHPQPRAGCSLELLSYWERIVLRIVTILIFVFKNTILVMKYFLQVSSVVCPSKLYHSINIEF